MKLVLGNYTKPGGFWFPFLNSSPPKGFKYAPDLLGRENLVDSSQLTEIVVILALYGQKEFHLDNFFA